jgi:hypothetical protein
VSEKLLIDQRRAAELLGVSERALEAMRLRRTGPAYIKITPRSVRYSIEDLERFIESRRIVTAQG